MRNGNSAEILTIADIQDFVKVGWKTIEIYEGQINKENIQKSPFKNFVEKIVQNKNESNKEGFLLKA